MLKYLCITSSGCYRMSNFHLSVVLEKYSTLQDTKVRKCQMSIIFSWPIVFSCLHLWNMTKKEEEVWWVGKNNLRWIQARSRLKELIKEWPLNWQQQKHQIERDLRVDAVKHLIEAIWMWLIKAYQTWLQKLCSQEHEEALLYHKHYPQFAS